MQERLDIDAMRLLIQRVQTANVKVKGQTIGQINQGLLSFLGIEKGDNEETLSKLINKVCDLRIFSDENGKMNLSLKDISGSHLIVSQFTLAGNCEKGRRPSFDNSEDPKRAKELYELAIEISKNLGVNTESGEFAADMQVHLVNDGPVTFIIEG